MEDTKTLENEVFEALGTASMCWEPKPTGVFESEEALKVGNDLMIKIRSDVSNAVDVLTRALVADKDFFYAYQANIAMAIKDEFNRSPKKYKSKKDLHEIANNAAINFLNLLCETSKDVEGY